jgi:hypothetical protein
MIIQINGGNDMKKVFLGCIVEGIIIIVSLIKKDIDFFTNATGIVALGSIGIAMILSGLVSGNIYRRTAVENSEERNKRISTTETFLLFGLPSILTLIIYFVF